MGLSKVEICNHALLKIGADTIASLDINQTDSEAVVQSAKLCGILFDQALEETLRTYKWNSALKRSQLSRLTDICMSVVFKTGETPKNVLKYS